MWRGGLIPDRAAGQSILVVDGVTDTGIKLIVTNKWKGGGGKVVGYVDS
ncbi:MAG: hypothetical protein ACK55I_38195 [bacterium]